MIVNKAPLMDIHQIMDMLPHRPPFLLIDRIIETIGYACRRYEERDHERTLFHRSFSRGTCDARGFYRSRPWRRQGGILVLSTVPDPENYLTLFMKIDNVKIQAEGTSGRHLDIPL